MRPSTGTAVKARAPRSLAETERGRHVQGDFARVELIFECVARAASR